MEAHKLLQSQIFVARNIICIVFVWNLFFHLWITKQINLSIFTALVFECLMSIISYSEMSVHIQLNFISSDTQPHTTTILWWILLIFQNMRQEIEIAQLREENLILRSEIYFWTEDYGYLQQKYLNHYSINQVSIRV